MNSRNVVMKEAEASTHAKARSLYSKDFQPPGSYAMPGMRRRWRET